jgi:hypothetical protein
MRTRPGWLSTRRVRMRRQDCEQQHARELEPDFTLLAEAYRLVDQAIALVEAARNPDEEARGHWCVPETLEFMEEVQVRISHRLWPDWWA